MLCFFDIFSGFIVVDPPQVFLYIANFLDFDRFGVGFVVLFVAAFLIIRKSPERGRRPSDGDDG